MLDVLAVVLIIAVTVAAAELVRAACRRQLLAPARIDSGVVQAVESGVRAVATPVHEHV